MVSQTAQDEMEPREVEDADSRDEPVCPGLTALQLVWPGVASTNRLQVPTLATRRSTTRCRSRPR